MKSILLFFISIICYHNSISQHTPLNQLVKFKLPKGSEKLSNSQFQSFLIGKKGFNQNREWFPKGDVYRINTMVLRLNGAAISPAEKLEATKKGFDGMASMDGHQSTNYTSEIKIINNYKVLIMHIEGNEHASYSFFSINNLNNKVVNGHLEYDKFDSAKRNIAANTLSRFLKRMKFK